MTEQRFDPYYIFVWDNDERKLLASYYVVDESCRVPDDVSGGGIERAKKVDFLYALQEKYRGSRYDIGGGTARSLKACMEFYFGGMNKDYDHFFEGKE